MFFSSNNYDEMSSVYLMSNFYFQIICVIIIITFLKYEIIGRTFPFSVYYIASVFPNA